LCPQKKILSLITDTFPALKKIALLGFLLITTFLIKAQPSVNLNTGKITGVLIDSVDHKPIEYATIGLSRQNETEILNGTVSDSTGKFVLTNIPKGTYRIMINFLGYEKKVLDNIIVNEKAPLVSLGTILLSQKATTLQGVTVTAEKSIIENKIDKMVYNVENDITSQSGVAIDVLKKVPQVSVDVDGNVELQGNSNIRFLIDGKPSTIYGNSIVDVLQSIPASQIQSIEVITSPGAKYDAEGTGGIINILLKKTRVSGISGNVSLSAGTRLENGSFNINARTKNFGVNAFLSGNAQLSSNTIIDQERWTQESANTTQLLQHTDSKFQRNGFQTGLGFDWTISKKDNLTGGLTYNHWAFYFKGLTDQNSLVYDSTGGPGSTFLNDLNVINNYHSNSLNWSLNYKHTFNKKGQELNIQYNSSYAINFSDYRQTEGQGSADSVYSGIYGSNPGTDMITEISADYNQPINDKINLQAGMKASLEDQKSSSLVDTLYLSTGSYVPDYPQSYTLDYSRNIYAAYLTGTFSLFNFLDIKPGIRVEHTDTRINYAATPGNTIPSYTTFVPSLILSHNFKNNNSLKLSYSYRIQRPDYRDLNPFINLSDPHNISIGNPNLKPEVQNRIELGYNKSFKKGGNLNLVAYYRWNTDDFQSFVIYYPEYKIGDSTYSNVTVTTRANISSETTIGGNIYGSFPIASVFNIRSNISLYNRAIREKGPTPASINSFEYRITLNLSYEIMKTLALEAFGYFNSARTAVQGKLPSWSSYSFAIRQKLFHDKASIALTASNPFNEYVIMKTNLTGEDFTLKNTRKVAFRSFGINLTYKFGKMKFQNEREEENNNLMNGPGF
jgi:outer membrane receptor protein involved in Fe transport